MSLYEYALTEALSSLQQSADHCARALSSVACRVEYRILYTAGDPLPWRLVEVLRDLQAQGKPQLKRRVHCFESSSKLNKSLSERILWKIQDRALVSAHLAGTRNLIARGQPGEDQKIAKRALQSLDDGLRAIEPDRRALKQRMCVTHADRLIELARRA